MSKDVKNVFHYLGTVGMDEDDYLKLRMMRDGSRIKVDEDPRWIVTFPYDDHRVRVSAQKETDYSAEALVEKTFRKA